MKALIKIIAALALFTLAGGVCTAKSKTKQAVADAATAKPVNDGWSSIATPNQAYAVESPCTVAEINTLRTQKFSAPIDRESVLGCQKASDALAISFFSAMSAPKGAQGYALSLQDMLDLAKQDKNTAAIVPVIVEGRLGFRRAVETPESKKNNILDVYQTLDAGQGRFLVQHIVAQKRDPKAPVSIQAIVTRYFSSVKLKG
jgi:hypothetical protein